MKAEGPDSASHIWMPDKWLFFLSAGDQSRTWSMHSTTDLHLLQPKQAM